MPLPVDAKWIRQTEEKLSVRFPAAFVVAMVKMNGGMVRTRFGHFELFPFLDASDRKSIGRTCSSICRETATLRKASYGYPEDAVAIGTNGAGEILVLLPMPDLPDILQHGVFCWNNGTGEIELVANDFSELGRG